MFTMLLGGLWHGANWTFVVWGAIHGVGLSLERFVLGHSAPGRPEPSVFRTWMWRALTFHAVCLAWVFFRADNISGAVSILKQLAHFQWSPNYAPAWLFLGLAASLALAMDLNMERSGGEYVGVRESPALRWAAVAAATFMLILFSGGGGHAFIYFPF